MAMKRNIVKITMITLLLASSVTFTNCAKEGCPASMALQNETMGTPSKKKSKAPKNTSGVLIPEGKKGNKY
jgi:hypothetical protein